MTEPTTYRDPARVRRHATLEVAGSDTARRVAAFGSVAAIAGAGALAVGQVELWALAGAGAFAAAAHLVRAARARRRKDALTLFFGTGELVALSGAWTSIDGQRRLRVSEGDASARWEHIDPTSGETLASYRAPALLAPQPHAALVIETHVALVHGRAREPRCFTGLPRALGGSAIRADDASSVVLYVRDDGVLLERRDAEGQLVGDTLHPDRSSALRQLDLEYGAAIGSFHGAPSRVMELEPARPGWDEPVSSSIAL